MQLLTHILLAMVLGFAVTFALCLVILAAPAIWYSCDEPMRRAIIISSVMAGLAGFVVACRRVP